MSASKNNFRDQRVLNKVEYHCWIVYLPGAKWMDKATGIQISMPPKKTYNGFISKPDKGLQGLRNLVQERASIIEKAIMYNTQLDIEIMQWDTINKCWK